ncbi:MAG: hypothetical protein J5774_05105 [Clostridia bacterium]|nr:hypothetical protein [Clostridia bacterium]
MRWYKRSVVFAVGLFSELIVATISCLLIKENRAWLQNLVLPYFAPRSFLFYAVLMEVRYLSAAAALALYVNALKELPKGLFLTCLEGAAETVTLLFFFKFTYEITAFFLATATMVLSVVNNLLFLSKNDAGGIFHLPATLVTLYFWTVIYCILSLNFA